jgi:hypothetical protein
VPECWLIAERPPGQPEPADYWLSNLPAGTALRDLVRRAKVRWRIEHDYRELKDGLGLDHFEGRSYAGWHRHVTRTAVVQAFCTQLRYDPQGPCAGLTLYAVLRDLQALLASGWLSRATRIVENEVPQLRGELLGAAAYVTDDPVRSEALAREAAEIGRANDNSSLELMAMHAVGQALVQQGRTEEGMSLLDEAMAGVIGGEGGDPLTVAQMSCMTMVVCGSCFDIVRATQWVQSLERFIDRYGCPFLYAECRTYYGRVLFENGDWSAAEELLTDAISMSRGIFPAPHAFASGTLAELRLAQGRVEDAARVLRGVEGREEAAEAVASL